MLHSSVDRSSARRGRLAALTLCAAAALAACGGGGGNPGTVMNGGSGTGSGTGTGTGTGTGNTTPTVPATASVAVSLVSSAGQASNALSSTAPLTVRATLLDSAGKAVPNALVTFATDNTLALFAPSAGTALTNAEGVASVTLKAASLNAAGAAKLTATADVNGTTLTSAVNYALSATPLSFGSLSATPKNIAAYETSSLSVEVLAGATRYTAQPVKVSFSSACISAGKATLSSSGSTNQGVVQAIYRDLGCATRDTISVSAEAIPSAVQTDLEIAQPAAASVQFVAAEPVDKSIVMHGQGGINRTETATLKFRVFDIFGQPLARRAVNFAVSVPNLVTLNKNTDLTDLNGEVSTSVNSGAAPTTFRVIASLPGTATTNPVKADIATTSDSIVVSTGLPVQRAFSLSAGKFNLEGWTVDSSPNTPATYVQALLADGFGNPVPDGTPVVFQSNMGSIGSADKGGCNTLNGGCSVDFRTQEPRRPTPGQPATPCNAGSADSNRPGLATICASSTDGSNTIFGKIALFFSGSNAANVFLNGASTRLSGTTDLGTTVSADPKVFVLQLNDVNLNPLPQGTRVEVTNLVNSTSGPVVPATVPNIEPHTGVGDDISGASVTSQSPAQGSSHTFSISNPLGKSCTVPATATFNVTVTSPGEVVTTIPFKLTFSCP